MLPLERQWTCVIGFRHVMQTKRIEYLDALKGFAIFLMVVGHVIPWSMPDLQLQDIHSYPCHIGLLWNLIYSFHMPLFFMISGYFTYKYPVGVKNVYNRVQRLLIPYVVTGFLLLAVRGHYGYWFLFTLFVLSLLAILLTRLLLYVNKANHLWIDAVFIIALFVFLRKVMSLSFFDNPFCEFDQCGNYALPFFVGYLMKKYNALEKVKWSCFSLLFVAFAILFSNKYWQPTDDGLVILHKVIGKISQYCTAIIGSLLFWELFRKGINRKVQALLSVVGKYSMEIYILHILFVVQIKEVGLFWIEQGVTTCLTVQVVYSTFVAALAIFCSVCLARFIKRSKLMSRLMFGS